VLDTIAPGAPVLDAPPEYVNDADLTITGNAEPNSHVELLVGDDVVGEAEADEDGVFTIEFELEDRLTALRARATDLAGNLGAVGDAVEVILDTEAPVAVAGADIDEIEDIEVTLDASASTDNEGIAGYNWTFTIDGAEVSFQEAVAKYTFADPAIVTLTLTVTDLAGNTGTDTLEAVIRIANQPPNLDQGVMDPDKGNTGTKFKFVVTYKDPDEDNGDVWVIIDGESFLMTPDPDDTNPADGQVYIYETKLTEGTHSYYFTGRDSFGNDAIGPSAGDSNSKTTQDIDKKKTEESPSLSGAAVMLAVVTIAAVLSRRRRRV
jgi:hypothetical protein